MERTNNFDGLRLIAALAVVCSHMAALGGEREWRPVHGLTWGLFGVLVFFSISGYLVMASWRSDPNIGRFLERRFLRISPALLVVMPVTFLLAKALGVIGFPGNPYHNLNGSLWTIEYEVICYFVLVALAVVSRFPALLAGLLVAASVALGLGGYLTLFAAPFALGMALHEYPQLKRWSWAVAGLGLAAMPYHHLTTALIVAPAAVFVGERSWPALRSAGRYGDLSYGTYVYAYPIQQIVVHFLGTQTPYFTLLAVSLPLILSAAWASWHFVEAPTLARKPQKPAAVAWAAMRADDSTEPKPAHSLM